MSYIDNFMNFATTDELNNIAGIIIGVIFPISSFLTGGKENNSWDGTVISKYIMNLKKIVCAIATICAIIFLGKLLDVSPYGELVKFVKIILYTFSLIYLFTIIWKSVNWVSGSENDKKGIRYKYRKKVLVDNSIYIDKRYEIWEMYLGSLSKDGNKPIPGFTNKREFVDILIKKYQDLKQKGFPKESDINFNDPKIIATIEYIYELLKLTRTNLDKIFDSDDQDLYQKLIDFALNEMIEFGNKENNYKLEKSWYDFSKQLIIIATMDKDTANSCMEEIETHSTEPNLKNERVRKELADLVFTLVWECDNLPYNQLSKIWKIKSINLSKNDENGLAQNTLLELFWKKLREVSNNPDEKSSRKIDRILLEILPSADPITFRQTFEILEASQSYNYTSVEQSLLDILKARPFFGLASRNLYEGLSSEMSEKELAKILNEREREQYLESINICLQSREFLFPNLTNYINKTIEILESDKFKEAATSKELKIHERRIRGYLDLLKDIKNCYEKPHSIH